jgi:hypothetical protein
VLAQHEVNSPGDSQEDLLAALTRQSRSSSTTVFGRSASAFRRISSAAPDACCTRRTCRPGPRLAARSRERFGPGRVENDASVRSRRVEACGRGSTTS